MCFPAPGCARSCMPAHACPRSHPRARPPCMCPPMPVHVLLRVHPDGAHVCARRRLLRSPVPAWALHTYVHGGRAGARPCPRGCPPVPACSGPCVGCRCRGAQQRPPRRSRPGLAAQGQGRGCLQRHIPAGPRCGAGGAAGRRAGAGGRATLHKRRRRLAVCKVCARGGGGALRPPPRSGACCGMLGGEPAVPRSEGGCGARSERGCDREGWRTAALRGSRFPRRAPPRPETLVAARGDGTTFAGSRGGGRWSRPAGAAWGRAQCRGVPSATPGPGTAALQPAKLARPGRCPPSPPAAPGAGRDAVGRWPPPHAGSPASPPPSHPTRSHLPGTGDPPAWGREMLPARPGCRSAADGWWEAAPAFHGVSPSSPGAAGSPAPRHGHRSGGCGRGAAPLCQGRLPRRSERWRWHARQGEEETPKKRQGRKTLPARKPLQRAFLGEEAPSPPIFRTAPPAGQATEGEGLCTPFQVSSFTPVCPCPPRAVTGGSGALSQARWKDG